VQLSSLSRCASLPSRLRKLQIRPYSASAVLSNERAVTKIMIPVCNLPVTALHLCAGRFWSSFAPNGTGIPAGSFFIASHKIPSNLRHAWRLLRHVLQKWQFSYLDTHPGNVWFCKQLQGVQDMVATSIWILVRLSPIDRSPMIFWYLVMCAMDSLGTESGNMFWSCGGQHDPCLPAGSNLH